MPLPSRNCTAPFVSPESRLRRLRPSNRRFDRRPTAAIVAHERNGYSEARLRDGTTVHDPRVVAPLPDGAQRRVVEDIGRLAGHDPGIHDGAGLTHVELDEDPSLDATSQRLLGKSRRDSNQRNRLAIGGRDPVDESMPTPASIRWDLGPDLDRSLAGRRGRRQTRQFRLTRMDDLLRERRPDGRHDPLVADDPDDRNRGDGFDDPGFDSLDDDQLRHDPEEGQRDRDREPHRSDQSSECGQHGTASPFDPIARDRRGDREPFWSGFRGGCRVRQGSSDPIAHTWI